jgi:hypothetical protein
VDSVLCLRSLLHTTKYTGYFLHSLALLTNDLLIALVHARPDGEVYEVRRVSSPCVRVRAKNPALGHGLDRQKHHKSMVLQKLVLAHLQSLCLAVASGPMGGAPSFV